MGLHNQGRIPEGGWPAYSGHLSHTTLARDQQDHLDEILPVRCYFCTLVTWAGNACSYRGIWICGNCFSVKEVRSVVDSPTDNVEVQP